MKAPLFTCVIPVKGDRPFFKDALASLEAQGMGDELEVIVQDGTTEYTDHAEIPDGLNVKWFRESDVGQSDALNKGFAKADGEWLFWLNADDVLLPGALWKVRDYIGRVEHVEWIAGNTIYIDKYGTVIGTRCDAKWHRWFGKHMSVWTGGPSAFFRRELWHAKGRLDVDLKYVMDLDLWTRWARAGIRFKGLNEYLWGFRVHGGSATTKISNRREIAQEFQEVLRRFNICHEKFWRNMTRLTSVFDGSRWRKIKDSCRFRGGGLVDCVGRME